MAAGVVTTKWLRTVNLTSFICARFIHKTLPLCEITSGKYKRTKDQSKPLTYEQAHRPAFIAHRKSWNSWNTSTLQGGQMISDTLVNDLFIRRFINGTFPTMVSSEIIIKRQHNMIRVSFLLLRRLSPHKLAFLYAYSEEMLGYWLQCIVKLEPQLILDKRAVVHQYVDYCFLNVMPEFYVFQETGLEEVFMNPLQFGSHLKKEMRNQATFL